MSKEILALDEAVAAIRPEEVPDVTDWEGLQARCAVLRDLVGRMIESTAEAHREQTERMAKLRSVWEQAPFPIPEWGMVPDYPGFEPGTPKHRQPRPIYYGYEDSGYRISLIGNRAREGHRISRRSFQPRTSWQKRPEVLELKHPRSPNGQLVIPPCRIWCPVCNTLNDFPLPAGFEVVSTAIPPETLDRTT